MTSLPRIDLVDRPKEILVTTEFPGIEKDNLDVSITDRRLVIKAKSFHGYSITLLSAHHLPAGFHRG